MPLTVGLYGATLGEVPYQLQLMLGVGVWFGFSVKGGTPPYTVSASGLPTGLTLLTTEEVSDFGEFVYPVRGAPSALGTFSGTFHVTDSLGASGSVDFGPSAPSGFGEWVVQATQGVNGGTPDAALKVLPPATPGSPYSFAFTQAYADAVFTGTGVGQPSDPPYTYTNLAFSEDPGGMILTSAGVLMGTPTSSTMPPIDNAHGNAVVVFTITGNSGTQELGTLAFHVLSSSPPTPPTIDCNNPPDGVVGVPYSHALTFSGGTPPYSFAIISGALPDGLSIDPLTGVIFGTPTKAGTFGFTVQVLDSDDNAASVTCSIGIIGNATIPLMEFRGVKRYPISQCPKDGRF